MLARRPRTSRRGDQPQRNMFLGGPAVSLRARRVGDYKTGSGCGAGAVAAARSNRERSMARDFEDHCWKDVIDADTMHIYQAYRRKIFVGDNPAVLAIDLYNKAYLGGNKPVKEVDREFSGSCGENAW